MGTITSYDFENGKMISQSYYREFQSEEMAKIMLDAYLAEAKGDDALSKYETVSIVGKYIVVVDKDLEELAEYECMSFDEVVAEIEEVYAALKDSDINFDDEED